MYFSIDIYYYYDYYIDMKGKNIKTDYVYKNNIDSIRIRIYQRDSNEWDYDIFHKDGTFENFAENAGDAFALKRDAKAWAEKEYGKLISLGSIETVTEGW